MRLEKFKHWEWMQPDGRKQQINNKFFYTMLHSYAAKAISRHLRVIAPDAGEYQL